ncbi:hypothetical protein GOP47_0001194, partial [Adiantum capillus-veneris]
ACRAQAPSYTWRGMKLAKLPWFGNMHYNMLRRVADKIKQWAGNEILKKGKERGGAFLRKDFFLTSTVTPCLLICHLWVCAISFSHSDRSRAPISLAMATQELHQHTP